MIPNTASLIVSAAKFAFKRPSAKLGRCSVPAISEQPNRRALKYTFRISRCKTHLFRVVARNYELQKQPNTRFFRRQAFNYVLLILARNTMPPRGAVRSCRMFSFPAHGEAETVTYCFSKFSTGLSPFSISTSFGKRRFHCL